MLVKSGTNITKYIVKVSIDVQNILVESTLAPVKVELDTLYSL